MVVDELSERIRQAPSPLIAGRIRRARRDLDVSHDKLAELVGTSRQHLIKLEKNQHRPRAEMLTRISEATGKPLEFFLDADAVDNPFPQDEAAA